MLMGVAFGCHRGILSRAVRTRRYWIITPHSCDQYSCATIDIAWLNVLNDPMTLQCLVFKICTALYAQ